MIQQLSQSKMTTVAGATTTLGALIISLIPQHVWSTCSEAVMTSNSPMLIGAMVAIGMGLTVAGPSLSKKSENP